MQTAVEWKLYILKAINLAIEEWDEIPARTPLGKRQASPPRTERSTVGRYDDYLQPLHEATRTFISK